MTNRRNILAILGLATTAATTPAMALEGLDVLDYGAPSVQERMASMLENMAAAIRSGELTATEVEVSSRAAQDEFIRHEVRISCEIGLSQVS